MVNVAVAGADVTGGDTEARGEGVGWTDPLFRYIPLIKDDGRWKPCLVLPENCAPEDHDGRAAGSAYWQGAPADWPDLQRAVAAGQGVGVLVERSGLVVLDCDVRMRDEHGYVVQGPGRAVWSGARRDVGFDDLARVCAGLGHEVPATYTVRTKSGGVHLYYRTAPNALKSSGHREGWAVDVKASAHTWVVAPPTEGYRILTPETAPVAPLPEWLLAWLRDRLAVDLPPLGGAARAARTRSAGERFATRPSAYEAERGRRIDGSPLPAGSMEELIKGWAHEILVRIRESNYYGGWNNEIYIGACRLSEAGYAGSDVLSMILEAATPWNEAEKRTVERTVASALGRVSGGEG